MLRMRRPKDLQFFRDIYLLGLCGSTKLLGAAATGQPFWSRKQAANTLNLSDKACPGCCWTQTQGQGFDSPRLQVLCNKLLTKIG
jgi:hypothetical protein